MDTRPTSSVRACAALRTVSLIAGGIALIGSGIALLVLVPGSSVVLAPLLVLAIARSFLSGDPHVILWVEGGAGRQRIADALILAASAVLALVVSHLLPVPPGSSILDGNAMHIGVTFAVAMATAIVSAVCFMVWTSVYESQVRSCAARRTTPAQGSSARD